MRKETMLKRMLLPICGALLSFAMVPTAQAVPSFARQTGVTCAACHTAFPQLTAFGRQFKMKGYTLTSEQVVKGDGLDIDLGAPLSMMIQTTYSRVKNAGLDDSGNVVDNKKFSLPSQLSIFYAGRITDKIGTFVQVTDAPSEGDSLGMDNTDIRYADTTKGGTTWGIDLNNNPTVQDPWNSTNAWGFPWFEAGFGYAYPHPLMEALGQQVAGLTGYALWNNHLYTEAGLYQEANTTNTGTCNPGTTDCRIKGSAPYWRLAYTGDAGKANWEVGAFGFSAKAPSDGWSAGNEDKFSDTGLDTQWQWMLDNNSTVTVDANYVHESQKLNSAAVGAVGSQHLNTMKADVTWYKNQTWGVTAGLRNAKSSDNAVSFSDDFAGDGIANGPGSQDSNAYMFQVDYTPWLNTRFAVQYTDYTKLNGTKTGASDNNQLMVGAWFLF